MFSQSVKTDVISLNNIKTLHLGIVYILKPYEHPSGTSKEFVLPLLL
jgi:hypothetical protein